MNFVKMQGLGNDFIVIEDMEDKIKFSSDQIIRICDRHFGIGADGLMLVRPSNTLDIKMVFYNQDGTEAAMCGNGVRCFAKYVYSKGIINKEEFAIETNAGKIYPKIIKDMIKVNMGKAEFNTKKFPININIEKVIDQKVYINEEMIIFSSVLVGVPHTIIEVDDISSYPVKELGPLIENHTLFPSMTNVNFVEVLNNEEVKMITWERGAGLTLACGTGACAVATILREKKIINDHVLIHLPGGLLTINIVEEDIFMTGPAQEVYKGYIDIKEI